MKKFVLMLFVIMSFTACASEIKSTDKNENPNKVVETNEIKASESGEKTKITFLYIWPEHQEVMDKSISMFEEANPNIKIEPSIVPWNEVVNTIQTSHASGEPFDVMISGSHRSAEWKIMNVAGDMTPYIDDDYKKSMQGGAYDLGIVDGGLYSVPFRATGTLLMYNKSLVRDGIITETEFVEALDKLLLEGKIPIVAPGNPNAFQLRGIMGIYTNYDLYKKGILMDPEYKKGYRFDINESFEKGASKIRDMFDKKYINPDYLAMKREEAMAEFFKGNVGFTFINNNELVAHEQIAKETGLDIGFMNYPKDDSSDKILIHALSADSLMYSSNSKYPKEAVEFIKFLTSKEVQEMWANETLSIMGNNTVFYDNKNQKIIFDCLSSGVSSRQTYAYPMGSLDTDEGILASEYISTPNMTPSDYAKRIVELREAVYKENSK